MADEERAIGVLVKDKVVISDPAEANRVFNKGWFGGLKDNKLTLSLVESMYLLEKNRLVITTQAKKTIDAEAFMRKATFEEKRFPTRYSVYKDIRERGYITKTALKYGADFRVYERGTKPGDEHAKWVLYAVRETESFDWRRFAAMMRVAHSVRKTLLVGIVDDEGDVTYYDINWTRP
jgi:tRNA-intron endonuclease